VVGFMPATDDVARFVVCRVSFDESMGVVMQVWMKMNEMKLIAG